MNLNLSKSIKQASVSYREDIAYEVNKEFLDFTGYNYHDIIGKTFRELIELLRADVQIKFNDDQQEYNCYIFTNNDQVKNVKITQKILIKENKREYVIEENMSSLLKGVLSTCGKNSKESTAIISYPELIHLKINENYEMNSALIDMNQDKPLGKKFLYPDYIVDNIKNESSCYKEELEFIDNSGKVTYWTINSVMIFEEGRAKYLRCSFFDETEKVMAKRLIEIQKREMEIVLENIPDSIIKLNNQGEYTYLNKSSLEKLSNYNLGDKPLNIREIYNLFKCNDINGNEVSYHNSPETRVLRGEEIKSFILIGTSHLPTTYHQCTGIPIYDEGGNIESAVLIYKDIEKNLKLEEYNSLVENIKYLDVKYAILSRDFKIKYVNENGFKAIKVSNSNINALVELIGRKFFDFYNVNTEEEMQLIEYIEEAIKNNCSYKHKQRFIEGEKVKYVKSIFQPVFDKNNKVKEINVIGMDITEEEDINKKMSDALISQEEIFINTSHELKTPLNLIFSASQLISIYLKSESIENKKLEIIRNNKIVTQNCYRLIKLVNNILDVSKIEEGFYELNLENRNIISDIENIVESVAKYIENMELNIIFDSSVEEKIMAFDVYKLERVILNLISNAIKFSNLNGIIMVNVIDRDEYIEISVSDNGIGIDKEHCDIIFNKFKQVNKSLNRKVEGTGIGLCLVKSIVELHNGKISVDSNLGMGSTFKIELPITIVDEPLNNQEEYSHNNRVEMIKFELSDIYS